MDARVKVDRELLDEARRISGCETDQDTVAAALRLLIAEKQQVEARRYRGKLTWRGDLEQMRLD